MPSLYIPVFVAELSTIVKRWKQAKYPSRDRWINKMYTMEYDSALKRDEILTHGTAWMKLVDIMLNKIRQTRKDKYRMIPLI